MKRPVAHTVIRNISFNGQDSPTATLTVPDVVTYEKKDTGTDEWRILVGGVYIADVEIYYLGDNRNFYQQISILTPNLNRTSESDLDEVLIEGWGYTPIEGKLEHITGATFYVTIPASFEKDIPSHDRLMADH